MWFQVLRSRLQKGRIFQNKFKGNISSNKDMFLTQPHLPLNSQTLLKIAQL